LGKKLIEAIGLRPVDRTLGAVFGVLRGVLILLVLVVMAGLTGLDQAPWWQEARSAVLLSDWVKELKPLLPQELGRHLPA
jgi:membrane protein required for colicin V production